jgi:hypothetical protein
MAGDKSGTVPEPEKQVVCPCCGRCPHCGRGGEQYPCPAPYHPIPWWVPYPADPTYPGWGPYYKITCAEGATTHVPPTIT